MNLFANSATTFSAGPGSVTTFRKHTRFASLVILFALLTLSLGCGLIGGGGADEEELPDSDQTTDSGNLKETDAEGRESEATEGEATEADAQAEAEGDDPQAEDAAEGPEAEAAAEEEPAAEPEADAGAEVRPMLVQDAELARDLAWAHLSQCVTLKSIELAATLISAEWFIVSSAEATRAYGFWRVDAFTGAVRPHDTLSRQWQAALDSQCNPESLEAIVMPAGPQAPVIGDAADALATVWSFLSRCYPNLEMEICEATHDPARGEWVVVTKTDSGQEFGTWIVAELTGELEPYAGLAQAWDSTVKLECSAEDMAALVTPTPVPKLPPAVKEITEAVTNLWAHLVKCAPAMTVDDLVATWNPVNDEWVVLTKPGVAVDYGVWILREDGGIIPENLEAVRRNEEVGLAAC